MRSLALLPFIEPDVIKLDLRLVQDRPSADQAAIVSAVAAESERTGAAVLAEGIETEEHLAVARALGATLGQGFRWGRPAPLAPGAPAAGGWRRPAVAPARLRRAHPVRGGRRRVRDGAGDQEPAAADESPPGEPRAAHRRGRGAARRLPGGAALHPATAARYRALQRGASLVAALGVGLGAEPVEGVRGAAIPDDDALAGEWSVIVVGPHFAGALVAQDLGDDGADGDRRFAFATTYRRDLVIAAARTLLERRRAAGGRAGLGAGRVSAPAVSSARLSVAASPPVPTCLSGCTSARALSRL